MENKLQVTGERMSPGESNARNERDHLDRYAFASQFVADKSVLDIACGTGFGSKMMAEKGAREVCGIDISTETITYAQEHFSGSNVKYVCASAEALPLKEAQYDVAVSFETIEHLEDPVREKYLSELHRVLKPGGMLILSTPNKRITSPWSKKPNNPFHVLEFTLDHLCEELRAGGFEVREVLGQRLVLRLLTWYAVRKAVRMVEKIIKKNFHLYDVASGPGVMKVPSLYVQRYFVVIGTKNENI